MRVALRPLFVRFYYPTDRKYVVNNDFHSNLLNPHEYIIGIDV